MAIRLGIFVVPDATDPESTVEAIIAAEPRLRELLG
jgi:hypothetical protein